MKAPRSTLLLCLVLCWESLRRVRGQSESIWSGVRVLQGSLHTSSAQCQEHISPAPVTHNTAPIAHLNVAFGLILHLKGWKRLTSLGYPLSNKHSVYTDGTPIPKTQKFLKRLQSYHLGPRLFFGRYECVRYQISTSEQHKDG